MCYVAYDSGLWDEVIFAQNSQPEATRKGRINQRLTTHQGQHGIDMATNAASTDQWQRRGRSPMSTIVLLFKSKKR